MTRIGSCSRCMRMAFKAAILGWVGWFAIEMTVDSALPVFAGLAVAVGLTGLWLAHLSVMSARWARAATPVDPRRRRLVSMFVRALALTAAASAVPRAVLAQNCSCAPDHPVVGYNVYRRECFCCLPGRQTCYDESESWCCNAAAGHYCGGTTMSCT